MHQPTEEKVEPREPIPCLWPDEIFGKDYLVIKNGELKTLCYWLYKQWTGEDKTPVSPSSPTPPHRVKELLRDLQRGYL